MCFKKVSSFIFLASLLSSCGFHLRGYSEMPSWLTSVSIIDEHANRDFDDILTTQLKANHIEVDAYPTQSAYWLIINDSQFDQQITSISSSTTPRQYQLIYTVNFNLQRVKGKLLLPFGQVKIMRQITINTDRILGSTFEEDQTKRDMMRDAAIQIIERLSRAHEY